MIPVIMLISSNMAANGTPVDNVPPLGPQEGFSIFLSIGYQGFHLSWR